MAETIEYAKFASKGRAYSSSERLDQFAWALGRIAASSGGIMFYDGQPLTVESFADSILKAFPAPADSPVGGAE